MAKTPTSIPSFSATTSHPYLRTATVATSAATVTAAEAPGQVYARLTSSAHGATPPGQEEYVGITTSTGTSIVVAKSSLTGVS